MPKPELWLIAGPNGAGKTTAMAAPLMRSLIQHVRFLNADDRTLEKLRGEGWNRFAAVPESRLRELFIEAAEETFEELMLCIDRGVPVGSETVLSTHKYQPAVEAVQKQKGFFGLLYVALRSPELSAQRIAQRVQHGGHDVPTDRLSARWQRSIENLGWYARRAQRFFIYDNSDSAPDRPPSVIAHGGCGELTLVDPDAIPAITASLTRAFTE